VSASLRPALGGDEAREQAEAAKLHVERIAARLACLDKHLKEPELKPLQCQSGGDLYKFHFECAEGA
jgi:hypothetical protein